jgi:hypothetical protein
MKPLEKRISDTLEALRKPPSGEKALEALVGQWAELRNFSDEIARIKDSADPVSRLVAACEAGGDLIPEFYALRVERWVAYYRVDQDARLCSGILISHDDDSIVGALGFTLKEIFARFAEMPGPKK